MCLVYLNNDFNVPLQQTTNSKHNELYPQSMYVHRLLFSTQFIHFQDIISSTSIYGSKQLFQTFICMFDISILNEMFTTSLVAAVHKVRGHYERK